MEFFQSMSHPDELLALIKFKLFYDNRKSKVSFLNSNKKVFYELLNQTSRSFAAVIQALDGDLRHAICIFYLVLRALDTIEDDMTIPNEEKFEILKLFYTFLEQEDWSYNKSKEKDKIVLEQFPLISKEFRSLSSSYRLVISDICKKMGHGMCEILSTSVDTLVKWDQYCHYAAGLVGIGLTRMFIASGLEDPSLGEDINLANSMGLFLQKTNIIRDYFSDLNGGRQFWPEEVWKKYGKQLSDFQYEENSIAGLECLSELIHNALQHVEDCLTYLAKLKNQSIFNFCAIPQVMAIATLERCYNNRKVLKNVVKIRKGEAVSLILRTVNMQSVNQIFYYYSMKIAKKQCVLDSKFSSSVLRVSEILHMIKASDKSVSDETNYSYFLGMILFGILIAYIVKNYYSTFSNFSPTL